MNVEDKSVPVQYLRRVHRTRGEGLFSSCLDCFVPRSDVSPTSLRGTNFALAEGCDEAISPSMTDCKEQMHYHVTTLAWARLSPCLPTGRLVMTNPHD